MEGHGESLVAMVQGLDSPGITVTVCSRLRLHPDRRRSSRHRIQMNPAITATPGSPYHTSNEMPTIMRPSVDTNTQCEKTTIATGAQICDGRYTSSYKLAHCMVTPTSPPEAVSEFPPQRKEPCRSSTCRTKPYIHQDRDMEAFAQSLRKYPSINHAPYRIASTDLIEKIIRYTQAKSSQESSRTKSMRCLQGEKSSEHHDMSISSKSKHQQTYTRKQDSSSQSCSRGGCKERRRDFQLHSPGLSDSGSRDRVNKFNSSYDYLKAGNSRCGRSHHTDGSRSPDNCKSPEDCQSPEGSKSPDGTRSRESRTPERSKPPSRSKSHIKTCRPDLSRSDRRGRCQDGSVRNLSLSDLSKHLRSITIRRICNEKPLVFQVCPKLKSRYNQHKKICPSRNVNGTERASTSCDVDGDAEASGSILSRLMATLNRITAVAQDKCACSKINCGCTKSTQCGAYNLRCTCKSPTKHKCTKEFSCNPKIGEQAYYKRRIDDEISSWLQNVPIHSIERTETKKKRDNLVEKIKVTLKQLSDDDNFEENAMNEIKDFVDEFPMWNPGKGEEEERNFKNQLVDELTDKILGIPRKSDRFRDIVVKWIENAEFVEYFEDTDIEAIVNKLKSLAANRPLCDIKYQHILNTVITELLVELSLFDGDMVTLKEMANKLATEVVSLPRNVTLSDETELTSDFRDVLSGWICEHDLCNALRKNPELIISLAKKLKTLKSQGVSDKEAFDDLENEINQIEEDAPLDRRNQNKLQEVITDWLQSLTDAADSNSRQLDKITKILVNTVQESKAQAYNNVGNDIVYYLDDAGLSIEPSEFSKVDELLNNLNISTSNRFNKKQAEAEKKIVADILDLINSLSLLENQKQTMRRKARMNIHTNINPTGSNFKQIKEEVKEALIQMVDIISRIDLLKDSTLELDILPSKSATRFSDGSNDSKNEILKDVRNVVNLPSIDMNKIKNAKCGNYDIGKFEKSPVSENVSAVFCIKKMLSAVTSNHFNSFLSKCVCDNQNEIENYIRTDADDCYTDASKMRRNEDSIRPNQDKLRKIIVDWLHKLPGFTDFDNITEDLVKIIRESKGQGYDNVRNNIIDCLHDADINLEPTELSSEVKELLKKLNISPSQEYDREEAKRMVTTAVFDVIDRLTLPEDTIELMKDKARSIIHKNIMASVMNLQHIKDDVNHALVKIIEAESDKDLVKQSKLQLNTLLSSNGKSVESGSRFSNDSNDIKVRDTRDVKNAVDGHKNKDLHNVKRTQSNNMIKPYVINNIHNETCEIVEENTVSEDEGILSKLKNMLLPKRDCECNTQCELENDVENVIDKYPIDAAKKKDLMKNVHDILTENKDRRLSDEVVDNMKSDIRYAVSDLSISEDKKSNLKQVVGETVSKIINDDVTTNKLLDDCLNVIEQSSISRDVKRLLVSKIGPMLTRNLDSSLSDEEKEEVIDEISDIVKDGVPEEKRRKLENKLIKKLESYKTENEPEELTELIDTLVDNTIREMEKSIGAPIPKEKKIALKKNMKETAIGKFKNASTDDVQAALTYDVNEILDDLNLPKERKNKLKSELTRVIDKNVGKLQKEIKNTVGETIPKSANGVTSASRPINKLLDDCINVIEQSAVSREVKRQLGNKIKSMLTRNLDSSLCNEEKDVIIDEISDIVKDGIPEEKRKRLENKLMKKLESYKAREPEELTEIVNGSFDNTIREMEQSIGAPLPKEKKIGLKKKLNEIAVGKVNKTLTDEVRAALTNDVNKILDDLNIPNDRKNKLKSELTGIVDNNIRNLQNEMNDIESKSPQLKKGLKSIKEVDETKTKNALESLGPISEKGTLKREVKKAVDNTQIPEEKKTKLKPELTSMLSGLFPQIVDSLKEDLKEDLEGDLQEDFKEEKKDSTQIAVKKLGKHTLKEEIRKTFDKFGLDSSGVNTLTDNRTDTVDIPESQPSRYDKYANEPRYGSQIASKGQGTGQSVNRNIEEVRRKVRQKDEYLFEPEAAALAGKKIGRARQMAPKKDRQTHDVDVDPTYGSQLTDEFKNLQSDKGGESEKAERKLIQKTMKDKNLFEDEAAALASEVIGKAQQTVPKQDMKDLFNKYDIDPNYESLLKDEFNILLDLAGKDEDLEEARRKLIQKIMEDINLSEADATALADEMFGRARQLAQEGEGYAVLEEKIKEYINTHLASLGIKIDPTILAALIKDLVSDIKDRQKYLSAHPEIVINKNDEFENFNYQLFRNAKKHVGLKTTLQIMKGAVELHKIILGLLPPLKLKREQGQSSGTRSPQSSRRKMSPALSIGDINYSLKESLERNKFARKQWNKNLYEINHLLSTLKTSREDASSPKKRSASPKNSGATSSYASKLLETFTLPDTDLQSPFTPQTKQNMNEKEFTNFVKENLKTWLEKPGVNLKKNDKNKIIDELTRDIVDRHKFYQTYGSKDPSQCNDLEYLQLQIHRRLNALVPTGVLKPVIDDTKQFLAKVDSIQIPQMVAPESAKNNIQPKNRATSTDGVENERRDSGINFVPGQTSTPVKTRNDAHTKPADQENLHSINKLRDTIKTWMDTVTIDLEAEAKTAVIEDILNDVVERQEYLKLYPEKAFTKEDEIDNLKFQVFNRLTKVMPPDFNLDISKEKIEELYKMITGHRRNLTPKQEEEFKIALNEVIAVNLLNYNVTCQEARILQSSLFTELIKLKNSNADQDEIVENVITIIKDFDGQRTCYTRPDAAEELALKLVYRAKKLIVRIQEPKAVFQGCPISDERRLLMESQLAEQRARELGIPLEDSEFVTMENTGQTNKGPHGLSFNGLTNYIDTTFSNIPIDDENTKKEIAYSLIQRIGDMNLDPAIFNDDALYEAVLRDELQNLFGDISISDEEIQALKEDIMEKVIQAHQRAHDEIAGQSCKLSLRDAISNLLPDPRSLSIEDQATLEILKDQLADAFIDLHFSGGNDDQIQKLKNKISDQVNQFCKIYLNRYPCLPISSQRLNCELYTALVNVALPPGDSILYEVEQARIRGEINDWLSELPLGPQTPTELLARNKMIYVLSKKLFDIEAEAGDAAAELMKKEIMKFLIKMPLDAEADSNELADKLIDKLKATEESRKYDPSSNVIIDSCGNVTSGSPGNGYAGDDSICPAKCSVDEQSASNLLKVCGQPFSRQESFPPSTLSNADKTHLDHIKRRTFVTPDCVQSLLRNNKSNVCTSPRPVDAESQTVLRPLGMDMPRNNICPVTSDKTPRPCPGVIVGSSNQPCSQAKRLDTSGMDKLRSPCTPVCPRKRPTAPSRPQSGHLMRRPTISSENMPECVDEVQPQIVIKQYYWNPPEKSSFEESELQQSGRCPRRQSDFPRSSERNSFWDTPKSFQRPSPSPRSSGIPSPCLSPFGFSTPSPGPSRDNDCPMPKRDGLQDSSSRPSRKERVIELGSFDDISNQRSNNRTDKPDWSSGKFEDDDFWNSPMRRVILDEGIDEALVMEREQREERIRCNCKERLIPKCGRPQSGTPQRQPCPENEDGQSLKRCSKCCGLHCPYPSYLYFR